MQQRQLGSFTVSQIGLGCMNLSHGYGTPPSFEVAQKLLHRALDLGVTLFDTAALYGFGANEELIGKVLAPHRHKFVLASKCGIFKADGKRVIDGRAATIKQTCDDSLRRLQTDVIDLYYLHRWDKKVPIEESVSALADCVKAGKIKQIGLSEVSAATLRKAHAVHPIAALQTEYSLWTRNPDIAVLDTCAELGTTFVAFSPLARGFLGGQLRDVSQFEVGDIRTQMPRFTPENYAINVALIDKINALAQQVGHTPAQLALAWVLAKAPHIVAIPGTSNVAHLEENCGADKVQLSVEVMQQLEQIINRQIVVGARYHAATQLEIDTEEFES